VLGEQSNQSALMSDYLVPGRCQLAAMLMSRHRGRLVHDVKTSDQQTPQDIVIPTTG
jgi:hypothetical protein